jgi:beta-xylosidase
MILKIVGLLMVIAFVQTLSAQQIGSWGDQGDGTYKNPILETNYPDNDIIRQGDTYYMMSSTCHFTPGMVILKSSDLVNWEFSNYIMSAPINFDSNFNIDQDKLLTSRGTWAGSFGFNGEYYFAYWCYNQRHLKPGGTQKIFYAKARNMTDPWSTPKEITWANGQSINTTDPGVFWDMETQKAWIGLWTKDVVKIYRLTWDGDKILDNKEEGIFVTDTLEGEAVKIYKFDDWYYLLNIHLRDHEGMHQRLAAIQRAKKIEGPWEGRLILENGNGMKRSPAQGSIVKVDNGSWWFIHQLSFGAPDERYNGRPQFLEPMVWKDGWPQVGVDTDNDGIGEVVWHHNKPFNNGPVKAPSTDDDFSKPELGLQWYWRFNPLMDRWSLTERPGFLRLKSCKSGSNADKNNYDRLPNLLGQRVMGRHDNVMTAKFGLSGLENGQEVGFHISARFINAIGVKKEVDRTHLFFRKSSSAGTLVTRGEEIQTTQIWFQTKVENGMACFFYSLDGETFTQLGDEVRLLFSGFTTNAVGFYSVHPNEKGHVDIDWFTYDYDGPKSAVN